MNAGNSMRQITLVKVLQQASIIQVQIVFGIGTFERVFPVQRIEARLPIRKVKLLRVKQRLIEPSAATGHCRLRYPARRS